jgi:Domain of unknown function (DUF4062)
MLSNKRYQVFVSSTQADLRDEREAIINSLTKIGYIAVGMEQFPATDEEQMDYIRPVIDESDYYIVVIRGGYGSVGADGISYTEKEFRYAVETKKPALAFLYKDLKALRVADTDDDPDKLRKLHVFRSELEQKRIVNYWLTPDELVTRVKDSINDLVRRRPAVGWIRGDQALDPEVYRERDELRRQVESLRQKLSDSNLSDNLAHGDDKVDIEYSVVAPSDSSSPSREYRELYTSSLSMSCDEILVIIKDELYNQSPEGEIMNTLGGKISDSIVLDKDRLKDLNEAEQMGLGFRIDKTIQKLRFHFEALGLIAAIKNSQRKFIWQLTDKWRAYIARIYAFRKLPARTD